MCWLLIGLIGSSQSEGDTWTDLERKKISGQLWIPTLANEIVTPGHSWRERKNFGQLYTKNLDGKKRTLLD